jgi:membrane protease YdiL (CAAX protease family)
VLLGVVHLVGVILVLALAGGMGGEDLLLNLGVAAVVAPLGALYLGLVRHAPNEPTARAAGLVRPAGLAWAQVAVAFLAGVLLLVPLTELAAGLSALMPRPTAPDGETPQLEKLTLAAGALLLAAAAVEEMLYRGLVQSRLTVPWPRRLFAVALLYAAVQVDPRLAPSAFLLGLSLGVAAEAAGTVWAAIALHLGYRTPMVVLALLAAPGAPGDEATEHLPLAFTLACAGAGAALLWTIWRLRRAPPA